MLVPKQVESLWDMLLTYARAFAITVATVEYERGRVMGQMIAGNYDPIGADNPIIEGVKGALDQTRLLCADIPSLNPVCHQIDRITSRVNGGVLPLVLYTELESLQNRIMDELRLHYYYPVSAANAALYDNKAPLGEDVYAAFPSARNDICNAARCSVLGQGTAAVFHAMRVMEVALRVLARQLGINYAPSWESYLKQIQTKVAEKHANKTISWKRKEQTYLDICGDLMAVKISWRNPTMHIVREYDDSEASAVLSAVAVFISRLAGAGFKENGKPVAKRLTSEA